MKQKRPAPVQQVLLYEMGGMGASSLNSALQCRPEFSVTHANVLNHLFVRELNAARKMRGWSITLKPKKILEQCRGIQELSRLKVISLVDDPVLINLRGFFQNRNLVFRNYAAYKDMSLDALVESFFEKYQHMYPLTWFNKEPPQTLGLDVFSKPFPFKQKSMLLEDRHRSLLLLRNDLERAEKEVLIGEFLGLDNFSIQVPDLASEPKPISDSRGFVQNAVLPSSYVSQMLDSRCVAHFYSKSEIAAMKARWLAPVRDCPF